MFLSFFMTIFEKVSHYFTLVNKKKYTFFVKKFAQNKKWLYICTINNKIKHKTMKPSKELLHKAKAKAKATFKPNRNNTIQSIRLTSDEKSYTLFYLAGIYYIGTYTNESLPPFFKNKSVYQMQDEYGKVNAEMQRLIVR